MQISSIAWGRIEVTNGESTAYFKDCKIWPGGARAWEWSETGTRHNPGIQPADVDELLTNGAEVIVLSRGMFQRLAVCPETEQVLREKGIEYHVLETWQAVELFNRLSSQGIKVGGLFHTTC